MAAAIKVTICLDNESITNQAAEWYFQNAYTLTHQVNFLYMKSTKNDNSEEQENQLKIKIQNYIEKYNLSDPKIFIIPTESNRKEPLAKELLNEIEKIGSEMIVLGCKYNQKASLGSVSGYVIKNTKAVCLVRKTKSVEDTVRGK